MKPRLSRANTCIQVFAGLMYTVSYPQYTISDAYIRQLSDSVLFTHMQLQ